MQLVKQQYHKYGNGTDRIASIVLTSETPAILSSRFDYNTSADVPFRFVVNERDVMQAHGDPQWYENTPHAGPTQIMVSSLAAIQMQLLSKYIVVNCCSTFHLMMLDMIRSGCGATSEPEFRCLQDMEDPQFHVCCGWDSDERCEKVKLEFRRDFQNHSNVYAGRTSYGQS
jgi:hypothetical protein